MPVVGEPVETHVEDGDGFQLKVIRFGQCNYPVFPKYKTIFPSLKNIEARPDDIIVLTFPKSGTTWSRALVGRLVSRRLDGTERLKGFLEMTSHKDLEEMTSPRLLYTHLTPDMLSSDLFKKKCRIVFVVRNVKDTIVSYYQHMRNETSNEYQGRFTGFLSMAFNKTIPYRSWFEHVRSWEKHFEDNPEIPVLYVHYEDMKEDCLREVKRMRDFLHLDCDDEFCQQVVHHCSFENMQSRDQESPMLPDHYWRQNKSVFFRKGEVGDWKNWYTVAENSRIDELYKKEMKGSNFQFRFIL